MPTRLVVVSLVSLALAVVGGAYILSAGSTSRAVPVAASHDHENEHSHADHGTAKEIEDHDHHHTEGKTTLEEQHKEGSEEAATIKIDPAAVETLNLHVLEVGSADIRQTIDVSARITLDQTTTAQVKARFAGVIRSVMKQPGEAVRVGEILATVESNDSLQVYPIKSPVNGTVISRSANVGEIAGDAPMFVIADLTKLWVEMFVFAHDGDKVKAGQPVRIRRLDDTAAAETVIELVLPTADASSQTIIGRASLENPIGLWRAGMTVRAAITHAQSNVPVAVRTSAIQTLNGETVVFLQTAPDTYIPQRIEGGMSDGTWTEVRSGLTAGQRYVATNSFILKAEHGKAGAEHAH